ncbi:unnamed protein product [Allacma fusca]|uniref:Uncharacterized protein n=1 Tax=Allacma fusca TaxID=39272 RepID=A0A8J2K6A9_9HEXA|nr:unnamed protein product [Allacma fusca]
MKGNNSPVLACVISTIFWIFTTKGYAASTDLGLLDGFGFKPSGYDNFKNNTPMIEISIKFPMEIEIIDNTSHSLVVQNYYEAPSILWSETHKITFLHSNTTFRKAMTTKHFIPHQALRVVHVTPLNIPHIVEFITKTVILGTPHRDIFAFVGRENEIRQLLEEPVAQYLKYKIGLTSDTSNNNARILNIGKYRTTAQTTKLVMIKDPKLLGFENDLKTMLNGRELTVLAAHIQPYLFLRSDGTISGGTLYKLTVNLERAFNFSTTTDVNASGVGLCRQGKWTGMTGGVFYRQYDIAQIISVNMARYGIIDTTYFQHDWIQFVTGIPKLKIRKHKYSVRHAIMITYQITLDQGFNIQIPTRVKFLSVSWMLGMVVLTNCYRTDLIKYFSFPDYEKVPADFYELDDMKDYHVVFNFIGGTSFQYFNGATNGVVKSLRERFVREPSTPTCIMGAIIVSKTVCVSWGNLIEPVISKNLSLPGTTKSLALISDPLVSFSQGFGFAKNSIYTDTFTRIIGYVRNSGLVDKYKQEAYYNVSLTGKAWVKSNETIYGLLRHVVGSSDTQLLKLRNVLVVFGVVLAGCTFGIAVIIIEIVTGWFLLM